MSKHRDHHNTSTRRVFPRLGKNAIAAILIALGQASPALAEEPIELIFNIFIPPQAGIVENGLEPWAREVEAASDGTLKLTIPTSSIAPVPQLWDAVEDGLADIALVVNASRANQVTLPTILNIPLVDGNAEQVSRALWETHYAHFEQAGEFGDLIPLGGFAVNGPQIMAVRRAVQTPEDLRGLKIRVEGSMVVDLFSSLGAAPIGASGQENFELLTGGIADASLSPFGSAMVEGQVGVTNEITVFPGGFSRSGFTIVMNRDKFESLPEVAQNAIMSTSGVELSAKLGAAVDAEEAVGIAAFEEAGANIFDASPEFVDEVRSKSQFIVDEWLAIAESRGIEGEEVLEYYLERVEAAKQR